jgi:hypothetical protein
MGNTDTARACGNGYEYRVDRRVEYVSTAERLLNQGQAERAIQTLSRLYKNPSRLVPGRDQRLDRALRVLAAAVVRMEGQLSAKGEGAKSAQAVRANLNWATDILSTLYVRRQDDAALDTLRGEAFALNPDTRRQALTILSRLEADDRIASPQGYAALAQLRRNLAADRPSFVRAPLRLLESGRARFAEQRCQTMSRGAEYCSAAAIQASKG